MQILRRIASRRGLLFVVALIVFAGLATAVFKLAPVYTATAQIVIEGPPGSLTNPLDPTPSVTADREKVASEVQVLMSRGLAQKAVTDLNISERPEFNAALDRSPMGKVNAYLGAKGAPSEIVDRFYSKLNVFQVGSSRVIAVEFSSHDPELARDAANHVADLYISDLRQASMDLTERSTGWMSEQIDTLRKKVAESEAKAEAFRAKSGLLQGNSGQLQAQQLTELNTQLSTARAARAEAEARVATLQRYAGSAGISDSGDDSELQVLQSPLIQQLRAQEVQLKREVSEMSAELLPTHPRMIQKQAELNNLTVQIRSEVQKVIGSVRNEARVAAAREGAVRKELSEMEQHRAASDQDEIQLRALEREATANRSVLESFLTRYTEISTRGDISIQEPNARVISRAEMPDTPSFPQKGPMLVLAGMISLAAGLLAVFFAELTNRKIRHSGDIELVSGVPVLASLPAVGTPKDEALRDPSGLFADGIRSLHAGLGIMPAAGKRGRIVAVTSTSRGEGRTTTAIALARSMAQAGLRVLLIDADFHQPGLANTLGLSGNWGFSDLVAGRAGFSQVIVRDPGSSVHVISTGRDYNSSVLASQKFHPVMLGLVHAYDAVVLDCEPVSSANAQMLMRLADQCIYAVRWNATERDRVVAGVRHLSASRGRGGVGLVLTQADASAVA